METNLIKNETKINIYSLVNEYDYISTSLLLLNELTATLAFNKDKANIQQQHVDILLQWYRIFSYIDEQNKGAKFNEQLTNELTNATNQALIILEIQRAIIRLNMDEKYLNLIEFIEKINNIILNEKMQKTA